MIDGKTFRDHGEALLKGADIFGFHEVPEPGDAIYVGLSEAVPSNAVRLRFNAHIEGVGVDPTNPPLLWEAWTGDDWEPCELDSDSTGGLNRDGDVVLHVPRGHVASLIAKQRAGWLRARVTETDEGQPPYSASPYVTGLTAITIGGTVDAVNAELVRGEEIGISEGVPGQRFALKRGPVVPGDGSMVLEVAGDEGWDEWIAGLRLRLQRSGRQAVRARHRDRARSASGPRSGSPTARSAATARSRPRAAHLRIREYRDGRRPAGQRRAAGASRAEVVDPVRVPRREPAAARAAAWTARTSRTPRSAARSGCGPAAARSPRRTTSSSPARPPRGRPRAGGGRGRRRGCGGGAGPRRAVGAVGRGGPAPVRPARPQPRTRSRRSPTAWRSAGSSARGRTWSRRSTAASRSSPSCAPGPRVNPTRLQEEALAGAVRVLPPDHRRPGRDRLAVRAAGQRGRGVLRPPGPQGTELVEDARLFGADPVTGQRGSRRRASSWRPMPWCSARAPGPGRGRRDARRVVGLASRIRWVRRCLPSTRTTTSRSGC